MAYAAMIEQPPGRRQPSTRGSRPQLREVSRPTVRPVEVAGIHDGVIGRHPWSLYPRTGRPVAVGLDVFGVKKPSGMNPR